jgi:UDP-2,4-diacetamido-2,4,6-trideoxy-beta-L-altropyranose hydrolase
MGEFQIHKIRLQPVRFTDCNLIWKWANDPLVRQASLSSTVITRDQHQAWFANVIQDLQTYFYIALYENTPIGQIRFDLEEQKIAVVSVSLASEYRGYGLGSPIIQLGVETLFKESKVETIYAYIKPENKASVKVFMKSGFRRQRETILQEQLVFRFVLDKERDR